MSDRNNVSGVSAIRKNAVSSRATRFVSNAATDAFVKTSGTERPPISTVCAAASLATATRRMSDGIARIMSQLYQKPGAG